MLRLTTSINAHRARRGAGVQKGHINFCLQLTAKKSNSVLDSQINVRMGNKDSVAIELVEVPSVTSQGDVLYSCIYLYTLWQAEEVKDEVFGFSFLKKHSTSKIRGSFV